MTSLERPDSGGPSGRPAVTAHRTAAGRTVYRLPLEVFPGLHGNAYLVDDGVAPILVDCGSGQRSSNGDLDRAMTEVRRLGGFRGGWPSVRAIVLTHGHIDHLGGLHYVREQTEAPVWVHHLDRRLLDRWDDRLLLAARDVARFLEQAGVAPARREQYLSMYLAMKRMFRSFEPVQAFDEGSLLDGALEAIHVPGHCPGQVCLRVDDVLLTADHVLPRISPHIAPEVITPSTGLGHYLDSLARVETLPGVRLGLGGHGAAIDDVAARVAAIRAGHEARLATVLEVCTEPSRIVDVSRVIFGTVRSYHVLLAVLEAGALVEYLDQRGALVITNAEAVGRDPVPVLRYRRAR